MTAPAYTVGQMVRLVQTRGFVKKADAGRLMTVRKVGGHPSTDPAFGIRVDDGDPSNPDLLTNGFRLATWLPLEAVEPAFVKPAEA